MICCSGRRLCQAGLTGSLPDERGCVFLGAARRGGIFRHSSHAAAVQPPTDDVKGPIRQPRRLESQ